MSDWRRDPFGRYPERLFVSGQPTEFVRTNEVEFRDPAAAQPTPAGLTFASGDDPAQSPAPGNLPPLPRRSRGKVWGAIAAAIVVGLGVAVVSVSAERKAVHVVAPSPEKHSIYGGLLLIDVDTASNGCDGQGGYSDISAGIDVLIRDGSNKLLASGTLGSGIDPKGADVPTQVMANASYAKLVNPVPDIATVACFFPFQMSDDVPKADDYVLTIGGGQRGSTTNTYAEMVASSWVVIVKLG